MVHKTQQAHLILASESPRRIYLLRQAGLTFDVRPSRIDETPRAEEAPDRYVRRLAQSKAEAIAARHPQSWVIGADTVVVIGAEILGKPEGRANAREMLNRLSGQTHQVFTGYTLCRRATERTITAAVRTDVTFKRLSDAEIDWYIQTGEPFDKAGAYAIQGMGTFLVRRINGSYTNVVGLPVCEVIEHMIQAGVVRISAEARI